MRAAAEPTPPAPRPQIATATSNLDKNYGISAKIDEQLKISAAVEKVVDKVDEVKSAVTDKVSDLKAKADSAP